MDHVLTLARGRSRGPRERRLPWGGRCAHGRRAPPSPAHLAPLCGGLRVSTDTCERHTRSSPATPTRRAEMEALQEQKTISGRPVSCCCCLSQLRLATALCCQPQERVLLLRRTSGNPRCRSQGASCPVTGKDKLQQCNARPPSCREHQKP